VGTGVGMTGTGVGASVGMHFVWFWFGSMPSLQAAHLVSAIGVAARATTAPGVHRVMSAQLRSLVGLAGTRSYCVALQRE
jgi:hypothetical protein